MMGARVQCKHFLLIFLGKPHKQRTLQHDCPTHMVDLGGGVGGTSNTALGRR